MGGGSWDASTYAATRSFTSAKPGGSMLHTHAVRTGAVAASVHDDLDPKKLNSFSVKIRECLDSDDHPNTTPIAVLFDETGSMGGIPARLVDTLEGLFGLLLRKGYCEDPQIMVGGIGDATYYEAAPLQISQFEADNRVDDALRNIYLEGNGGGNAVESYDLAMWFLANYVKLDSLDKRGKKGYLFIVGDEKAPSVLTRAQIKKYVDEDVAEDISFTDIVAKLKETWEVFWLYPAEANYFRQKDFPDFWRNIFGQNMLVVNDVKDICEIIGTTVGLCEGAIDDLDEAADDLDAIGKGSAKGTVTSALANYVPGGGGGGAVVASDAPADLAGAGADRL